MTSLKILHVVPSYKPAFVYGGPVFSISGLCEKSAEHGAKVTVFTTTANGVDDLPTHIQKPKNVEDVNVFYFKRWTKGNSNFTPRLLYRLLKSVKKYDVIHIHSWWNLVVIPAVFICLLRGVKPVLSLRGTMSAFTFDETSNSAKALFHKFIGKHLVEKCIIHVTSEKEQRECQQKIGDFQGFSLPNYINLQDAKAVGKTKMNSVFTIVILSRLHPVKNIELVLECLGDVAFDFRLIIIGKGDEAYVQKLKSIALEQQITNKVEWLGAKGGKEKFQLLASADLFIQLSLTENFGNSIIEAAAVGTPVLISENIGAADYVKKLELGWVLPLEKQTIINKLLSIFKDKKEGIDIRAQRKKIVVKEFYSKKLYSKYMNEYNRIQDVN